MRLSYAIIFVSDMKRSIAFYRDVLEMPMRFDSREWTEFESGGATLALHLAEKPNPHGGHARAAEGPREHAGSCRPGLRVKNLDEFHQRMLAHNVPCIEQPKAMFGTRIAQYVDPDGMAFSVGEERPLG